MPSNKNAVTRYYCIDQLLANPYHDYSISDICGEVNEHLAEMSISPVTRRTIEMDINYLENEGPFMVEIERYTIDDLNADFRTVKKHCLRYADRSFSIFKKPLTDDERYLLSEAISLMGQFDGLPNFDGLEALRQSMGLQDRARIVAFDKNPLEGTSLFGQLFTAISQQVVVELHLHTFAAPDEEIVQVVYPYLLKEYNRRWYVFAADSTSGKLMNFALDRIDCVVPLPSRQFVPYNGDLNERFDDIIGVTLYDDSPLLTITFWVADHSKDYVLTKPLHESQRTLRGEREAELRRQYPTLQGGAFFGIECRQNYELERELASFGKELIVLSPKEIQTVVFERIVQTCERYKSVIR